MEDIRKYVDSEDSEFVLIEALPSARGKPEQTKPDGIIDRLVFARGGVTLLPISVVLHGVSTSKGKINLPENLKKSAYGFYVEVAFVIANLDEARIVFTNIQLDKWKEKQPRASEDQKAYLTVDEFTAALKKHYITEVSKNAQS